MVKVLGQRHCESSWLRQRYGFWSGGYLSLFVDGLVGLGFWVGEWLRQLMGGGGFG